MVFCMDEQEQLRLQVEITKKRQILIGEYLALGLTGSEIITNLQEGEGLTVEDAFQALHSVYASWSEVRNELALQLDDERNWHIYLRMRLLQDALAEKTTPARRLALQILDSLAAIQGIGVIATQPIPIAIELVEKEDDGENESGEVPIGPNNTLPDVTPPG